ncbi:hypothetical protein ES705_25310 [subsurface metagenome]
MAKLKGPLMSLGASGKLADTLVFMSWKGLNTVREYVIPANPQTALQVAHREHFTAAVAGIHAAQARPDNPLNETDQVAYSALATAKGKIMTWFNQVVKLWVDVEVAVKTPCIYTDGDITDKDVSAIDAFIKLNEETGSTLAAGRFHFGTSKTNLIHSAVAAITGGDKAVLVDEDLSAFLTAGIKYYWQFRPTAGDDCAGADSGIYNFVAS